jgi:hypothetical protein
MGTPPFVAGTQGALSRDTMLHNSRGGELLPPARTNEREVELIGKVPTAPNLAASPAEAGN